MNETDWNTPCTNCGKPPISHWPDGRCVTDDEWAAQHALVMAAAVSDPGELGEGRLTIQEAAQAIRDGQTIRASRGDDVFRVTLEDGKIMCDCIDGWAAGVREPVCFADSDYLLTFLDDKELTPYG